MIKQRAIKNLLLTMAVIISCAFSAIAQLPRGSVSHSLIDTDDRSSTFSTRSYRDHNFAQYVQRDFGSDTVQLTGLITDRAGDTVKEQTIRLVNEKNGKYYDTVTDQRGYYEFSHMSEGVYQLIIFIEHPYSDPTACRKVDSYMASLYLTAKDEQHECRENFQLAKLAISSPMEIILAGADEARISQIGYTGTMLAMPIVKRDFREVKLQP